MSVTSDRSKMTSRPVASAPPPFYWKVPVPEKDYMSENYRRIRQIANQSQKKRSEPLKAAFIPGVTKNEKYAHVPSKVSEFLKNKKGGFEGPESTLQSFGRQSQRVASNLNQRNANPPLRRLSKSSTDLRTSTPAQQKRVERNSNGDHHNQSQSYNSQSASALQSMMRRRRVSEESFGPNQESVYNWRFKDDIVNMCPPGANLSNGLPNSSIPPKYCHRVEYLPCDGICAEENFVVDDKQPDSARSSSSCRTSRGCNTEETRILGDPLKSYELDRPIDTPYEENLGEYNMSRNTSMPKSKSVFTLPSQVQNKGRSSDWYPPKMNGGGDHELDSKFKSMKVSDTQTQEPGRARTSVSLTSLKSVKSQSQLNNGADYRHAPGTVPKYLKQRQEEWKVQAQERKEAELNANVPQGYVLLTDEERMEHLKTFKSNYDALINELNRIPIRIDTIRVKEHKVQLEQQLTRLEEAMKTFSRPRVWVKVDG